MWLMKCTCEILTSHKKVFQRKQAHVGMERSKTSQTRRERHHNTFTPSLHLVPFCQLCFVFVSCVHRRVEKGSGEGIAVCCVHVDVHGVCCVVGGCNVVATEHGRYSLSCMQKL